METFLNRNFKVKGDISCIYSPTSIVETKLISNIEVQLWHKSTLQITLLGKSTTNSDGEFIIEFEVNSPIDYIVDGKISNVFLKALYNGELLDLPLYDNDARLYFNQLTVQPSNEYKQAISDLVLQLKADDNWQHLDRFWIFATELQQHALVSLKDPSSANISLVNTPAWVVNNGFTSNGTNAYLNTNFNPTTDSSNISQNNISMGVYVRTNVDENKYDFGATSATTALNIRTRNSGFSNIALNQTSSTSFATSDSRGFTSAKRTASNALKLYRNGIQVGSGSNSSLTPPNLDFFICAYNNMGSPGSYSTKQIAMAFVGDNNINHTTIYTAWQTFAMTRGFNV